jgi:ribonuclease PH
MTSGGRFVEVQGTAEGQPFSRGELDSMLGLAEAGIGELIALQQEMVAEPPAFRPVAKGK